ncbi:MAG: hypothetical protein AAFY08_11105 [Planctomycetota bacterium]
MRLENKHLIPEAVAQQILSAFGVHERTRAYDRWIVEGGFYVRDFHSVLNDSPLIFVMDWRGEAVEDLLWLSKGLRTIGVDLEVVGDDDDTCRGEVRGARGAKHFEYVPVDGMDFDDVIQAVIDVIPETVAVRASPANIDSDTWSYAFLPVERWAELDAACPEIINELYGTPLHKRRPRRRGWRFWR